MGGSPSLVERSAFDVDHHERFSCCLQLAQQALLMAQQRERGAVEAFAAVHVAECLCIGHGSTGLLVAGLEVAGARASHHSHDDIGLARFRNGFADAVLCGVAHGTTLHVVNRHLVTLFLCHFVLDAFQHGLYVVVGLRSGVVAQLVILVVGIRTDDEQALCPVVAPQWQHTVVLQQRDAGAGGIECHLLVGRRAHVGGRRLRVDVGVVEQSHLELQSQDALAGTVDVLFADHAFPYGIGQFAIGHGAQIGVHASLQRQHTCLLPVAGSKHLCDAIDAEQVADDESAELPVVAQHLSEQIFVARAGNAVAGVVAGHHRERPGLNGPSERRQEVLVQLHRTEHGLVAVLSALGGAVSNEVLQCGEG